MKAKIKWLGQGETESETIWGTCVWEEYDTVFGIVTLEYYTITKKFILSTSSFEWEHLFQCSGKNFSEKDEALEYVKSVSLKYINQVMEFIDE